MICNSRNWQGLQLPALDLFIAIFGFSFRDLAFNTRWIFCMLSTLGIWWLLVAYSDIFRWTGDLSGHSTQPVFEYNEFLESIEQDQFGQVQGQQFTVCKKNKERRYVHAEGTSIIIWKGKGEVSSNVARIPWFSPAKRFLERLHLHSWTQL